MSIPRYYRLSVSTGTNCPHDISPSLEAYVRARLPRPGPSHVPMTKTGGNGQVKCLQVGCREELEHLKIKTSLINKMSASVMGEYVFLKLSECSL